MKIDTDTEEGKAELQKLIDKETDGLKAKNAELLGNQKKLKDDMKAIQEQMDEFKTAKDAAEEEAAKKSGDVEKITANVEKKFQKQLDELTSKLADKDGKLHKLAVDNGLTEALTKAGVAPQYLDAARALIQTKYKAEVGEADGAVIATFDGKPIKDFVSEWSQGDHGKHFIAAPVNGGGGANGGNGNGKAAAAKTMVRTEFDALPPAEQMKFSTGGGKLTD